MYRLIVEGTELVLPDGYKPDFSLNFAQIGKQTGSRVFPFTLPACKVNDHFFGYAHNPSSGVSRTKQWTATLLSDSVFLANGNLVLKMASAKGGYTCELQMPPALIEMKLWEQSLRSLDFGTVEMTTEHKIEDCYTFVISDVTKARYYPYFGTYYRIYVGNVLYAEYHATLGIGIYRDDFDTIYQGLADAFNLEERTNIGWLMEFIGDTLIVYAPANTDYVISIGFYKTGDPRDGSPASTVGYTFNRLEYDTAVGFDGFLYNSPSNSMFCLPVIKADKFYGDVNANYCGYLNVGFGRFDRNIPRDPLKFTLSPCLWFLKAWKKLFEVLGYTTTGDFVTDGQYDKAYLMTLVAIDRQCAAAPFDFNIWKQSINLASHLPNMTVKQFINSVCEQFGVDIDFEPLAKVATCRLISKLIDSKQTNDWSGKVGLKSATIEHQDKKEIQLAFADLTESETADTYYDSVPTDADKIDGEKYEPVQYKFMPPRLNNMSVDEAIGYLKPNVVQGSDAPVRWMPYSDRTGVSNLFDMWKNEPSNYVSFLVGLVAPTAKSMLQSANEAGMISLQIKGSRGFAVRNELVLQHLENTYLLKVYCRLTDAEIAGLRSWAKYWLGGVNFYLNAVDGKSGEVLKVEFRKA